MITLSVENKKGEVDRIAAVIALGLCSAIEENAISVSDGEVALFSPYSAEFLKQAGASQKIDCLVLLGAELEDVEDTPEHLQELLKEIKRDAILILQDLGPMDRRSKKWINPI